MNVLIVGCGGIGGYFGARLVEAGTEVTFLTRANTAAKLRSGGLHLKSARGDVNTPVNVVTADELNQSYDLVLLTCKSYDLEQCLQHCAAAINVSTFILPMLNGFGHYAKIQAAFPDAKLLYGYCNISAARHVDGYIQHYNSIHEMTLGVADGSELSDRLEVIIAQLKTAHFNLRVSKHIKLEMWEKFVFINALAGVTCLLRGTVGEILQTRNGQSVAMQILEECQQVAKAYGYAVRPRANKMTRDAFAQANSPLSASMLKDIQNYSTIELNLIAELCDFAEKKSISIPFMQAVYSHLQVYQNKLKEC
ncbi:2-dehydropantoate 2-reductase [Pseudoalteromonas sp. M8]|uniref:ketopantoate reductase family protein n=1 Tax=Pseudoalteromonas sp. M8 TaxID=2692624 RepID=UPI001BA6D389|nr:2-dehydropantoate 2-reductase [Pseudoalteromonas sp. M8]QUI72616.1 2-dehydropantoate 2-reductase [Pseudoalteromonas sp. M8]